MIFTLNPSQPDYFHTIRMAKQLIRKYQLKIKSDCEPKETNINFKGSVIDNNHLALVQLALR
jgi:hypothetical protein